MKKVTIQIGMNVPDKYSLENSDDIQQLLIDFTHKSVYIDGKII